MKKVTIHAKISDRIDKIISAEIPDISRARAQRLLDEGRVMIEGIPIAKSHRTRPGDAITVEIPPPEPLDLPPQDIPLEIVYEDADLLVINKPRGMVVHPAAGNRDGTLVNALLSHCGPELSQINGIIRPGIVHRIDKDTTGLLLVAKNNAAHISLAAQLKAHSIERAYLALVHGNVKEDGQISAPIARDRVHRKKMSIDPAGRSAVTNYAVVERFNGYTLLECHLETGRTHQIRVHMASLGHSVLGDKIYGPKKERFNLDGQLLHARLLGFRHPRTNEVMRFSAPPPEDFQKILNILKKS